MPRKAPKPFEARFVDRYNRDVIRYRKRTAGTNEPLLRIQLEAGHPPSNQESRSRAHKHYTNNPPNLNAPTPRSRIVCLGHLCGDHRAWLEQDIKITLILDGA